MKKLNKTLITCWVVGDGLETPELCLIEPENNVLNFGEKAGRTGLVECEFTGHYPTVLTTAQSHVQRIVEISSYERKL